MTDTLSLYIHIPFCLKKCAYCDFYSLPVTDETVQLYVSELTQELKKWGGRTDRHIDTIYFGGGTPSLLSTEQVKCILKSVQQEFKILNNCEITFEVNPATVNKAYLKELRNCGINRLSIGIQSAVDSQLKLLGRSHSAKDGEACFSLAREVGFNNISVDLMLCIPNSTPEFTKQNLDLIKRLSPEHISAYMLILEENTLLYKKRENYTFPNDDKSAEEYLYVCKELEAVGYEHYEISNFCKKGYESRHNSKYWLCKEYLGLGPSAYSFFNGKRFHCERSLKKYIDGCSEPIFDETGGTFEEFIMLGLRLKKGISKSDIEQKFKLTFNKKMLEFTEMLKKENLCITDSDRIFLTDKGMLVSNSVISSLLREDLYENI